MGHTPGPWKISHDEHEPYWNIDMPRQGGSPGYGSANAMVYTTEADAHVIAAAPELLAALKVAVEVMRDNCIDESMAGEFDIFTDAIAKAEGRPE